MLTSPDAAVRQATADYLAAWPAAARPGGEVVVFGSPAQRRVPAGKTRAEAADYAIDTFRRARNPIAAAGVRLCLEPIAAPEADLVDGFAEAVEILDRVGDPASRPPSRCQGDVGGGNADPRADPPPRRPHRQLLRQRPRPPRPRLRRRRFRPDLPGAAAIRLRRMGFGRGVRLLARSGDDRAGEPLVHARVRGAVWAGL